MLYALIITVLFVASLTAFLFVFVKGGYYKKLMIKLGLQEQIAKTDHTALAWHNCLKKMRYNADIVFFGDSITLASDFGLRFPDKRIVNLGIGGDTLAGMTQRIPMIEALKPEKIFIMGGINGLTDHNMAKMFASYRQLVEKIHSATPNAKIHIQSVLPVSKVKEMSLMCHNKTIRAFNIQLRQLAGEKNFIFVDLFSVYEKDGQMNPQLSPDGLHLNKDAYIHWEHAIETFIYE